MEPTVAQQNSIYTGARYTQITATPHTLTDLSLLPPPEAHVLLAVAHVVKAAALRNECLLDAKVIEVAGRWLVRGDAEEVQLLLKHLPPRILFRVFPVDVVAVLKPPVGLVALLAGLLFLAKLVRPVQLNPLTCHLFRVDDSVQLLVLVILFGGKAWEKG